MGTYHVPLHPHESHHQIQTNRREQKIQIHPPIIEYQTRSPTMRHPHPPNHHPHSHRTRIRRSGRPTRPQRTDSTTHHKGTLHQTHHMVGNLHRPRPAARRRNRHHDALPVEGARIRRGGGEGARSGSLGEEEEEGHLPSAERGYHAGADHDTGYLHGVFDLRYDSLHSPGRSHLRSVRRTLVRRISHRRDAVLRGAASQEHRRDQRREGGAIDGTPHQRAGERRRTAGIRAELPRQIDHTIVRRQNEGNERSVRFRTPSHRHRSARFRHHRSQRAGDDQGGAELAGSEGSRDHETEGGGRGGAQEHERGERARGGAGERIQ
mmetsp:Transcript_2304/g.4553  ORF Transcript_2304/g.4553 Transcript_2304/m.4553 type:complete len:322 (-) Transcript_2304:421-1386(-)